MKQGWVVLLIFLACTSTFAQANLEQLLAAEKEFVQSAAAKGIKTAFLEVLASDSIIFHPEAVNGREYWTKRQDPPTSVLIREPTFGDISYNGMLGYTMGNWRRYPKGKSEVFADFGQYVTVWEKRNNRFVASLDIGIRHERLPDAETGDDDEEERRDRTSDPNIRGWSPADASLNFLRISMGRGRLGAAYKEFADGDIRLLIEREAPIIGKKRVVRATSRYLSMEFPKKVALFEAADMAYTWNACQYANSSEGTEQGNCLHIWKLRKDKWRIVLAVFARVDSGKLPEIKVRQRKKKS